MAVLGCIDTATHHIINRLHGYELASFLSKGIDRCSRALTVLFDSLLLRDRHEPDVPRIWRARQFRSRFVLPRRCLVNRGAAEEDSSGAFRWRRLELGEEAENSQPYSECDVPLSALNEFGEGWGLCE